MRVLFPFLFFLVGILPDNIEIYATTAANAHESSYACYMDQHLNTYLGDVYSVNWMEVQCAKQTLILQSQLTGPLWL